MDIIRIHGGVIAILVLVGVLSLLGWVCDERRNSRQDAHVDLPPRTSPQNKQDAYGG